MNHPRLIARLDIKGDRLIKGINLEGLRNLGDSNEFAKKYYEEGIDELLYMDCVASLYERNNIVEVVKHTAQNIFIPLTVGGGVRSVVDADNLLRSGADKIAINTAATRNPQLITDLAHRYGNQCVVLSIEAKRIGDHWIAYRDNGRDNSGLNVIEWAQQGEKLGAGEILLTCVDKEGTKKGYNQDLIKSVTEKVNIPVIASGGFGKPDDMRMAIKESKASAVAIADALHYARYTISELREYCKGQGIPLRNL